MGFDLGDGGDNRIVPLHFLSLSKKDVEEADQLIRSSIGCFEVAETVIEITKLCAEIHEAKGTDASGCSVPANNDGKLGLLAQRRRVIREPKCLS
jgi:hypothetical protein